MKKVVCQCCGETLHISGPRAAFVPNSITCLLCVVDPSRSNVATVVDGPEGRSFAQRPVLKIQALRSPLDWLKRPLRKVFAPGDGGVPKPSQRV